MLLNVAFSELKMKKGKVVLTNRGSIALSPAPEKKSISILSFLFCCRNLHYCNRTYKIIASQKPILENCSLLGGQKIV